MNTDSTGYKSVIGSVQFPLDKIENQEEYDVLLEIPDEHDEKIINAKINAKIKFFWSMYKYFQDLYAKSEKILGQYKNLIEKSNLLLENLNEPMKFFTAVEDNVNRRDNTSPIPTAQLQQSISFDHGTLSQKKVNNDFNMANPQYQYADKVENFIKSTLSKIA
jgi:myo-inositol-1-phosphate synthase